MTPSLVGEEPDEVESFMSGFEAESGEAIPRLRLTRGHHHMPKPQPLPVAVAGEALI